MTNFIKEVSHPSIKATDDAENITSNKSAVTRILSLVDDQPKMKRGNPEFTC